MHVTRWYVQGGMGGAGGLCADALSVVSQGCRAKAVESLLLAQDPPKRIILVLNKIDLVPAPVVKAVSHVLCTRTYTYTHTATASPDALCVPFSRPRTTNHPVVGPPAP